MGVIESWIIFGFAVSVASFLIYLIASVIQDVEYNRYRRKELKKLSILGYNDFNQKPN